jgi:hypothetical protein
MNLQVRLVVLLMLLLPAISEEAKPARLGVTRGYGLGSFWAEIQIDLLRESRLLRSGWVNWVLTSGGQKEHGSITCWKQGMQIPHPLRPSGAQAPSAEQRSFRSLGAMAVSTKASVRVLHHLHLRRVSATDPKSPFNVFGREARSPALSWIRHCQPYRGHER